MTRPTMIALVSVALLVEGCSTSQTVPPGVTEQQLLEKIAKHAEGDVEPHQPARADSEPHEEPEGAESESSGVVGKCMVITMKVGATCLFVGGFGALSALSRGSGGSGSFSGVGNVLTAIWSAN